MGLFDAVKGLFGSSQPARLGRPACETDNYLKNREIRMRAQQVAEAEQRVEEVNRHKQAFHKLVGSKHNQKPLAVKSSDRSPNPSFTSLTLSHTSEPTVAGPSGATPPPSSDTPPEQPQSVRTPGSVPVYRLSDVKTALKNVVGIIPTSSLQEEMSDLYSCCHVLIDLLEKSDLTIGSAPHYGFIYSMMQQDLNDMVHFINEWTNKKSTFQHMQRNDVHVQVRHLEDVFTRHLNVFIALSQSESKATMNREFAELQAKMSAIQAGGLQQQESSSNSRDTEQAAPDVFQEHVHRITGHAPDAAYIVRGQVSREMLPLSHGTTFDVHRGKLDGDMVAIKLLRQMLKNDGDGVRFVERMMRQVQLWTSFSSPFILECYGIGMQMTVSEEAEEYDKFRFYLVSPFMRRGNAVQYIAKLRKEGAYVNILKYLRDAAFGIQYLHQRNPPCVHASIRPENVIIKDDGTACLNGFGLTKAFTVGKLIELTGDNLQYHWMAPELFGENPPLFPSCDIWAWAMTALQLISGKKPYYQIKTHWFFNDIVVKEGRRPQRSDYPDFGQNCPQPDMMWALLEECWASPSERPTIDQVIKKLENIEKAQIEQQIVPHVWT